MTWPALMMLLVCTIMCTICHDPSVSRETLSYFTIVVAYWGRSHQRLKSKERFEINVAGRICVCCARGTRPVFLAVVVCSDDCRAPSDQPWPGGHVQAAEMLFVVKLSSQRCRVDFVVTCSSVLITLTSHFEVSDGQCRRTLPRDTPGP